MPAAIFAGCPRPLVEPRKKTNCCELLAAIEPNFDSGVTFGRGVRPEMVGESCFVAICNDSKGPSLLLFSIAARGIPCHSVGIVGSERPSQLDLANNNENRLAAS